MIKFKLDTLLEQKNITRYKLSKLTGTDNNTLAKIYNNNSTQVKLETLDKICNALECDLHDLISYQKS